MYSDRGTGVCISGESACSQMILRFVLRDLVVS